MTAESAVSVFFLILKAAFGLLAFAAPPILLGVALRTVARRANADLISLLGATVLFLVFFKVIGCDVLDKIAPQVVALSHFALIYAVTLLFIFLFAGMAIPYLLVRIGVIWQRAVKFPL